MKIKYSQAIRKAQLSTGELNHDNKKNEKDIPLEKKDEFDNDSKKQFDSIKRRELKIVRIV